MAKKAFYISVGFVMALVILALASYASAAHKTKQPTAVDLAKENTLNDVDKTTQEVEVTAPPAEETKTSEADTIAQQVAAITPATLDNITPVFTADSVEGGAITPGDQPTDLITTEKYLKAAIHKNYEVSGWIYMKQELINFRPPDGSTDVIGRPDHSITEVWYHLNNEKLVYETVILDKTLDGKILQATVHHDGKSWNSISNATIDLAPYGCDGLFTEHLDRYLEYATVNPHIIELTDVNGMKAVKITSTEKYDSPMKLDGYDKLISGMILYTYSDIETGRLLQTDSDLIFEDNSTQLFSQQFTDIELGVTPTTEIIDLLKEK